MEKTLTSKRFKKEFKEVITTQFEDTLMGFKTQFISGIDIQTIRTPFGIAQIKGGIGVEEQAIMN